MASTYSDLKIQLMTTGENSTTWGSITNTNLGTAIEEAIAGSADVTFASNNVTLTLVNTNATQVARNMRLNLTGTTGGSTRTLTVPNIEKVYIVKNGCGDAIEVKNSTGSSVSVPAGKSVIVFSTGTGVVDAINYTPVANGGTGTNTLTANAVILGNGTSTVQTVAPGTAGNLLTSNGTTWASAAPPTSFVSGMILMWSGSIGTIPSGWNLCDGTNGTPNLTDRFVIGAGSTYAVATTGGSKDAIVVAHTHTATSSVTDPGHVHNIPYRPNASNSGGGGFDAGYPQSTSYNVASAKTNISVATSLSSTGSSGTDANLPPYYALAYIMKL